MSIQDKIACCVKQTALISKEHPTVTKVEYELNNLTIAEVKQFDKKATLTGSTLIGFYSDYKRRPVTCVFLYAENVKKDVTLKQMV